jgi:hypothetical protein
MNSSPILPTLPNVVASSHIVVTLIMEALHFSETSVLKRATRRNIPECGILRNHPVSEKFSCFLIPDDGQSPELQQF